MKKAIVIGATSGIGREIAKILTENGYIVGITGRRADLLNEIQNENPDAYVTKQFDVREINTVSNHLNDLTEVLGGFDMMIISSGTGYINHNLDFENEKRIIDTNITGFTCIAAWAFHYFEKQQAGHLIGISSIGGLRGSRLSPAYNATKAYQINYLEGLRQKSKKLNCQVCVTDIRPGLVDTAMAKGDGLFWVMPVEKAAKQIFHAITRKKKVAYITKRWKLIAILLQLIPRWVYDKM